MIMSNTNHLPDKGVNLSGLKTRDINHCIQILKKKKNRTPAELSVLDETFKNVEFFHNLKKELSHKLMLRLYSKIQLEKFKPRQVVYYEGDYCGRFYFLISGRARLYRKQKFVPAVLTTTTTTTQEDSNSGFQITAIEEKEENQEQIQQKQQFQESFKTQARRLTLQSMEIYHQIQKKQKTLKKKLEKKSNNEQRGSDQDEDDDDGENGDDDDDDDNGADIKNYQLALHNTTNILQMEQKHAAIDPYERLKVASFSQNFLTNEQIKQQLFENRNQQLDKESLMMKQDNSRLNALMQKQEKMRRKYEKLKEERLKQMKGEKQADTPLTMMRRHKNTHADSQQSLVIDEQEEIDDENSSTNGNHRKRGQDNTKLNEKDFEMLKKMKEIKEEASSLLLNRQKWKQTLEEEQTGQDNGQKQNKRNKKNNNKFQQQETVQEVVREAGKRIQNNIKMQSTTANNNTNTEQAATNHLLQNFQINLTEQPLSQSIKNSETERLAAATLSQIQKSKGIDIRSKNSISSSQRQGVSQAEEESFGNNDRSSSSASLASGNHDQQLKTIASVKRHTSASIDSNQDEIEDKYDDNYDNCYDDDSDNQQFASKNDVLGMPELPNQLFELQFFGNCYLIKECAVGDQFGELSLKYNIPEPYTAIFWEGGWLGYLERNDFDALLLNYYKERLIEDLEFLKGVSVFAELKPAEMEQIYQICEQREYLKDQTVYREQDTDHCLYLIRRGEIELSHSHSGRPYDIKNRGHEFLAIPKKAERMRISNLGEGELFGQNEVINKIEKRQDQAKCKSKSVLLFIFSAEKVNLMLETAKIRESLVAYSTEKCAWRDERLETIECAEKRQKKIQKHLLHQRRKSEGLKNNKTMSAHQWQNMHQLKDQTARESIGTSTFYETEASEIDKLQIFYRVPEVSPKTHIKLDTFRSTVDGKQQQNLLGSVLNSPIDKSESRESRIRMTISQAGYQSLHQSGPQSMPQTGSQSNRLTSNLSQNPQESRSSNNQWLQAHQRKRKHDSPPAQQSDEIGNISVQNTNVNSKGMQTAHLPTLRTQSICEPRVSENTQQTTQPPSQPRQKSATRPAYMKRVYLQPTLSAIAQQKQNKIPDNQEDMPTVLLKNTRQVKLNLRNDNIAQVMHTAPSPQNNSAYKREQTERGRNNNNNVAQRITFYHLPPEIQQAQRDLEEEDKRHDSIGHVPKRRLQLINQNYRRVSTDSSFEKLQSKIGTQFDEMGMPKLELFNDPNLLTHENATRRLQERRLSAKDNATRALSISQYQSGGNQFQNNSAVLSPSEQKNLLTIYYKYLDELNTSKDVINRSQCQADRQRFRTHSLEMVQSRANKILQALKKKYSNNANRQKQEYLQQQQQNFNTNQSQYIMIEERPAIHQLQYG